MLPITSAVFALIEGVQQKHITIPRKLVPFFSPTENLFGEV